MHGQPDGERRDGQVQRQDHETGGFARQVELGKADAQACAQQFPQMRLIVRAHGEMVAGYLETQGPGMADYRVGSIEAQQVVFPELVEGGGGAAPGQVALKGHWNKRNIAQMPGDQFELGGPEHAHGDIGLAHQQVLG